MTTYLVPDLERLKLWDSSLDSRDPSTDLATAWTMNRISWQWTFQEYFEGRDKIVVATLYIHGIEYRGSASFDELGIIDECSGSAYALARCRALIKMANENPSVNLLRDVKARIEW